MALSRLRYLSACALAATLAFTGCTGNVATKVAPHAAASIYGKVHGGQQPVTRSTIQLYAVGTTGDGSAATPLLTAAVQTDDNGNFGISNLYTCPFDAAEVYLVATMGNPGLATGSNNPNIAMMAALGPCGALASATNIWIDELTTIGSLSPLVPYMTGYASLGSSGTDAPQLANAFNLIDEFTNTTTGSVPGPTLPSGFYASQTEINTLGDILAPCINSTGGVAGDGSACGQLFTLTTPTGGTAPTDTIGAALEILKNPTANLTALLGLIAANPPYQPILTAPPAVITPVILPIAPAPAFSTPSGVYPGATMTALTENIPNATIYYTTTANPTAASYVPYGFVIPLTLPQTIYAYATAPGYATSPVVSATYSFSSPVVPTLQITPAAGAYTSTQSVTIASSVSGTSIYYTTDGTTPTFASTPLSGPIVVSSSETVKAIGITTQYPNTLVTSAAYVISQAAPQTLSTFAGQFLQFGFSGDGGPATAAMLGIPNGIAFDTSGNAYIADTGDSVIRMVTPAGIISTFAGIADPNNSFYGSGAYFGDGGPATQAALNGPAGVAVDKAGNVYIADAGNGVIRKVDTSGIISTIAGLGNDSSIGNAVCNAFGGSTPALATCFDTPTAVAVDASGNVYVNDYGYGAIWKVTPTGGISQIASGAPCPSYGATYNGRAINIGDGGPATKACVEPSTLALDVTGNLYIADQGNLRIRKVDTSGIITTIAGNGRQDFQYITYNPPPFPQNRPVGDGGPALAANIICPTGLVADNAGNVFVSESCAGTVREITAGGIIYRVAGVPYAALSRGSFDGMPDDGPATSAQIVAPTGLGIDANNNIYITDGIFEEATGSSVRMLSAGPPPATTAPPVPSIAPGDIVKSSISLVLTSSTPGATIYYSVTPGPIQEGYQVAPIPGAATTQVYSGPITVSGDQVVQAYASSANAIDSGLFVGEYYVSLLPAATPTFSPAGGTYYTPQTVTLASTTSGAQIYYTTDGTVPTTSSTLYNGPVLVSATETINAISAETGYLNSHVATAAYSITAAPPTFSIPAGVYNVTQNVSLSSATAGAAIFYTLDGSTPDNTANPYSGPITVSSTTTIRAIAIASGMDPSAVTGGRFVISPTLPVLSLGSGTFTTAQSVSITCATPGVTIYYTIDGTVPNSTSPVYAGTPIAITRSLTLNAITSLSGYTDSLPVSATYYIETVPPVFSVAPGTYTARQSVALSSTTAGATIYYTLDGSTPTASSSKYTAPISVGSSETISAYATASGLTDSTVATGVYSVSGIITTVVGTGIQGETGDGSQAASARIYEPYDVKVDSSGNLYIAAPYTLRKVNSTGVISTMPVTHANGGYFYPVSLSIDPSNNVYIADDGGYIDEVSAAGVASTIYNGTPHNGLGYRLSNETAVAYDNGSIYFADGGSAQGGQTVDLDSGDSATRIAGLPVGTSGLSSCINDVPATTCGINDVFAMAADSSGALYFFNGYAIFKYVNGSYSLYAGSYSYPDLDIDGGSAGNAQLGYVRGMVFDSANNLYVTSGNSIRKITPAGVITTVAGPSPAQIAAQQAAGNFNQGGFSGDGGAATSAQFLNPGGLSIDPTGKYLYIADTGNNRIRRVTLIQ